MFISGLSPGSCFCFQRYANGGLLTTSLYVTFDFVVATGILAIVSYIVAPRVLTSIEGEPLLIEDLVGRQELRNEFEQIVNKSEGWLRDEIEERVCFLALGL